MARNLALVLACMTSVACGSDVETSGTRSATGPSGTGAAGGAGGSDVGPGGPGGGGDGAGGGTGGEGGGLVLPPAPEVSWVACPEVEAAGFDCADVPVPLDWADLDGRTMTVGARRRLAATEARGSLMMLEGGPGAPGGWMLDFAARTAGAHPDLDVLIVDHRGTGASSPLLCEDRSDPPPVACLEALLEADPAQIAATSTSAAAIDALAVARWFGRGSTRLLHGRSYGTYWAHRVASLDPGAFDAVVLDSPCDAVEGCPAARRDAGMDEVVRSLLARCDDSPTCAAHLPMDAVGYAESVVASADRGGCPAALEAGIDGVRLRLGLARIASGADTRGLAPAVLVRHDRCGAEDAEAFVGLATWLDLVESAVGASPDFSLPTNYHVMRSEFWDPTFTVADAEAQLAATVASSGASLRWARAFEAWPWPPVEVEPALHAWRLGDTPTLVLTGGLDTATPAARVDSLAAASPGAIVVPFALAGHVPSADADSESGACARSLIDAFLADPRAPLDTSCVAVADAAALASLFDDAAADAAASWVFGTATAYGD